MHDGQRLRDHGLRANARSSGNRLGERSWRPAARCHCNQSPKPPMQPESHTTSSTTGCRADGFVPPAAEVISSSSALTRSSAPTGSDRSRENPLKLPPSPRTYGLVTSELGAWSLAMPRPSRRCPLGSQLYRLLDVPGSHLVIDQPAEQRRLLGHPPLPGDTRTKNGFDGLFDLPVESGQEFFQASNLNQRTRFPSRPPRAGADFGAMA